jgi:hypothetical protein
LGKNATSPGISFMHPKGEASFEYQGGLPKIGSKGGHTKSSLGTSNEHESSKVLSFQKEDLSDKIMRPSKKQQTIRMSTFTDTEAPTKRKRNFDVKFYKKINLFEGYPYVQYDQQTCRDTEMQKIIFRDQLLIIIDKLYQFKGKIGEQNKLQLVSFFSFL